MKKLKFKLTMLFIWTFFIFVGIFKSNVDGLLMVVLSFSVGLMIKEVASFLYTKKDA